MNLTKDLSPVDGEPGVYKTADGMIVELISTAKKREEPPPAAPAAAAPVVDEWTAARQRLEPAPIVPAERPTSEQLATIEAANPFAAAKTRLTHAMYGATK